MCGICGQLNFDSSKPVRTPSIQKMMDSIRHRGPDDEGMFVKENIGLGFRRLSIIDLVTGHQPISNADGSVWVILNGEIYNHLELRSALISQGYCYKTKSDTETIIHLYEEEGLGGFSKLNGMFAFALWDGRKKKLVIVRDRVGKKPLYYGVENGTIYFASEIKALFAGGFRDKQIDSEALSDFLSFLFVPAPKTMFKHIRKLLPGNMLIIENGNVAEKQYWDLMLPAENGYIVHQNREEYVEEFSALLNDAVRHRLISDVPLGAFLSGGLDSSSIVALMKNISGNRPKTFSVGYQNVVRDNVNYDERGKARYTANCLGTEHYEVEVKPADLELLPKIIWHLDEPMADISVLPTYKLSELTRQHVTVALSGDGSDEMLLGYGKHLSEFLRKSYMSIPGVLRKGIIQPVAYSVPSFHWRVQKIKNALRHSSDPLVDRALSLFAVFQNDVKKDIFNSGFYDSLQQYQTSEIFSNALANQTSNDSVNLISYLDFKFRLVDQLLLKLDKISMSVGLEARTPFLDYRLLEYIVKVPPHVRLHLLRRKYLLFESAKKWLPKEVVQRKKQGFGFPITAWLRDGVTKYYHDILLDERTTRRGYFQQQSVERMLKDVPSGDHEKALTLTVLLFFELWCRTFLDGDGNV